MWVYICQPCGYSPARHRGQPCPQATTTTRTSPALRDRLTGLSRASLSINESLGSVRSLTGVSVPSSSRVGCQAFCQTSQGLFKGPPTSAPGELVEPSGTVLRQAQDERVRSTPNILKGPASFQYGKLACWWFPEPVPVNCNSSLHITAATTTFPASHADVGGHTTEALRCPGG